DGTTLSAKIPPFPPARTWRRNHSGQWLRTPLFTPEVAAPAGTPGGGLAPSSTGGVAGDAVLVALLLPPPPAPLLVAVSPLTVAPEAELPLLLPVPVELQAARLNAIAPPSRMPCQVFM